MPGNEAPRIDAAELERLVQAAEPSALLIAPRLLRRVIKNDRGLGGLGLQVPHHKTYVLGRDRLLTLVSRDELGLPPGRELPDILTLLARPEPEKLAARPRPDVLVEFWEMLFHARVDRRLDRRFAERPLSDAEVRRRIDEIGQAEFDEIREVLRQDHYLLPPFDDATQYAEFAAVYLELRYFVPALLPRYFPALTDHARIDALLARDVDARPLFEATRPAGAPDPGYLAARLEEETAGASARQRSSRLAALLSVVVPQRHGTLLSRAERAGKRGNVVRAAIFFLRAARGAEDKQADAARDRARKEVGRLASRLQAALALDDDATKRWRGCLNALAQHAADGIWPAEARLLYDLQKVCVDHEREVYALNLTDWALSLGRRPVKRALPGQREVLMAKHLRTAAGRVPAARLSTEERARLSGLLDGAVHAAEERLRQRFRPLLRDTLTEVGLRPENYPERVALDKLTEVLLDRVVARGFVTLGDLRDAVSGNNLKLPDLAGPGELLLGDPLLRGNRRLARVMEGVYRGGEGYLRFLQRCTSLAFGTRPGRFLVRYVVLPFGGAFVVLEGLRHMVEPAVHWLAPAATAHAAAEAAGEEPPGAAGNGHEAGELAFLVAPETVVALGFVLFALLHVSAFRGDVLDGLRLLWRGVRGLFYDLPVHLARLPLVRSVLDSSPFRLLRRFVLKPALVTAAVWGLLRLGRFSSATTPAATAGLFLAANVFLNTRLGRDFEEVLTDWAVRGWNRVRVDFVPALFRFVMDVFKRLLEATDRVLYTVDEWLRFRSGEGRLAFAAKLVLGFVWFFVTYVVRLCVNLFIEPTVNPIKHFPAVTVAAKVLAPFFILLFPYLQRPLVPFVGGAFATTIALNLLFWLPGVFGFLVWEFKENWRLYRANRPRALRPVVVGSHGETVLRLLRPGLHSGTLPKLYTKLRRAARRTYRTGHSVALHRHAEALHHVEESVGHFVERDFLALLRDSRAWRSGPVGVGEVAAASNRIRVELVCERLGEGGLWLAFEDQSGWLVASVAEPGWLARLSADEGKTLTTALAGFYKMSGVNLVREQIEARFEPKVPPYDVSDAGLVVWPDGRYEAQVEYDFGDGEVLLPRTTAGKDVEPLPPLQAYSLFLDNESVSWQRWVEAWEQDQAGKGHPEQFLAGVRLLPGQK